MSELLLKELKNIKDIPGLYIGCISLVALNYFILGYSVKEYQIEGENQKLIVNLREFESFIRKTYQLEGGAKGYATLISEISKNDEEAFHKFFELLEEYLGKSLEEYTNGLS